MADNTARDALQRGIAAWLPTMSEDELRVVDAVVTELLVRREHDTGPLDRIELGLAELAHAPAVSRTPAGDIVIGPLENELPAPHAKWDVVVYTRTELENMPLDDLERLRGRRR